MADKLICFPCYLGVACVKAPLTTTGIIIGLILGVVVAGDSDNGNRGGVIILFVLLGLALGAKGDHASGMCTSPVEPVWTNQGEIIIIKKSNDDKLGLGLKGESGTSGSMYVDSIAPGSLASQTRLQTSDAILAVEVGKTGDNFTFSKTSATVTTLNATMELFSRARAGEEIKFAFSRPSRP